MQFFIRVELPGIEVRNFVCYLIRFPSLYSYGRVAMMSSLVYCFDWSISLWWVERREHEKKVSIVSGRLRKWMMCYVLSQHIRSSIWMNSSNRNCNSFCKLWIRNEGEFLSSTLDPLAFGCKYDESWTSSSGWKIKYYLIIKANTRKPFLLRPVLCFANIYESQQKMFFRALFFLSLQCKQIFMKEGFFWKMKF